MKIHLEQYDKETEVVLGIWEHEDVIPHLSRKCDGLMMSKGNEEYFTDDMDKVTCKRCIKMWNKFVRDNK